MLWTLDTTTCQRPFKMQGYPSKINTNNFHRFLRVVCPFKILPNISHAHPLEEVFRLPRNSRRDAAHTNSLCTHSHPTYTQHNMVRSSTCHGVRRSSPSRFGCHQEDVVDNCTKVERFGCYITCAMQRPSSDQKELINFAERICSHEHCRLRPRQHRKHSIPILPR